MVASDLEAVRKLRNHVEVRRFMFSSHEISQKEHAFWFEGSSADEKTTLLIFELDKMFCGFVQFKETIHKKVADWGFYLSPEAPKGTGQKLGMLALTYGFQTKKFRKICGQVLHTNRKSISFHQSLGFTQEGVMRDHYFDEKNYQDLVCFGLLRNEWHFFQEHKWKTNSSLSLGGKLGAKRHLS